MKNRLLVLTLVLLGTFFGGRAASAVDGAYISVIMPNEVSMELMPGQFGTETQSITATTTNIAGYTINLSANGVSNELTNEEDDRYTIPTFTLPPGADSIPEVSLPDGYGYSIDDGDNYMPVPPPNTPAVQLFKTTSPSTNTHNLTFGIKTPTNIPAGTYSNHVIITIVANLEPCPPERICYFGNGDDQEGAMEDQLAESNTEIMLNASNFSRPGYGFAGWSTSLDGTGTTYGPNETIDPGDLSVEGLQLYARWIPSSGNLQGWAGCETLNPGEIIALTDTRDGNAYTVTKYADGNCWMMENLRLDLSDQDVEITRTNTNKPTAEFVAAANAHPAPSNSFCAQNTNATCVDQILYNVNNMDRDLTPSYNTDDNSSSWYSYGGYYNWYTATAGNGTYSLKTRGAAAEGSLCPAGWTLPTGFGMSSNLSVLDIALGGTGGEQSDSTTGEPASKRWRAYPLNFIFSGEQNGNKGYNRGASAGFNTINTGGDQRSINLWIRPAALNIPSNTTLKTRGQTIRCIASEQLTAIGNIHYEANGGTGTMQDDINVDFATATAAPNAFTREHYAFVGWNTKANNTGAVVADEGSVEAAAKAMSLTDGGTLTLYAIWKQVFRIVYDGNNAEAGSMAGISHGDIETNITLVPSNFSRTGYGFVGWSLDPDASTKLQNQQSVTIYGPNQIIRPDSTFRAAADSNNIITLYAVWLPADTNNTMQTFDTTACNALSAGNMLALEDERDHNVYAVAKLADSHCWMIENLRLNPSTTAFTVTNTNNPTADFISEAAQSSDSNTLCNDYNANCIDQVLFNGNNVNRQLTASYTNNDTASSWYSYGMMYGWYTATAGNGTYSFSSGNVAGDICPANWRLPTGGNSGEFDALANLMDTTSQYTMNNSLLAFPNNFIYSGDYNYDTAGGRSTYGRFYSATPYDMNDAFRLGVGTTGATPYNHWGKWDAFAVRCIVK